MIEKTNLQTPKMKELHWVPGNGWQAQPFKAPNGANLLKVFNWKWGNLGVWNLDADELVLDAEVSPA